MNQFNIFTFIFLLCVNAFSAQNPISGTNYFFAEGSRMMYEITLNEDGTGRLATNNGASDIKWSASTDYKVITVYPSTSISYISFPVVGDIQVETVNTLKVLTIDLSTDVKLVEFIEQYPYDTPSDIKTQTETTENVKFANNFTETFSLKQGDVFAVPVELGTQTRHAILNLTEKNTGRVLNKYDAKVSDTFSWSISKSGNQLNIIFADGKTFAYNLVSVGDMAKISARQLNNAKTELIVFNSFAKVASSPKIDVSAFTGSYEASASGIDSIVYDFLSDGTGGFSYTDNQGASFYNFWAWNVDATENVVVAKRYRFGDESNPMGPVDTKADLLDCVQGKTSCYAYNTRTYKVLSSSNDQLVVLRYMEYGSVKKNSTSDIWTFKKK